MIPSRFRRCHAGLLLSGLSLTGCATGHQFSIAMANPGSAQTVLVVGDADPGDGVTTAGAPLPRASNLSASMITAALSGQATGLAAAARSQTLALPSVTARPVDIATPLQPAATPSVQATITTPAVVATSTPAAGLAIATPSAQVSVAGPALQLTVPSSTLTASSSPGGVQANLSAPGATASASLSSGKGMAALQAVTAPATLAVAVAPSGVQAVVTTPAIGAVASSVAPVQTLLAGASGALNLAAPSPGAATPTASVLKALTGGPAKKLKHG